MLIIQSTPLIIISGPYIVLLRQWRSHNFRPLNTAPPSSLRAQAPFYFINLQNVFVFSISSSVASISLQRGDVIAVNLAWQQHCVRSERKRDIRAELCLSSCRLARRPKSRPSSTRPTHLACILTSLSLSRFRSASSVRRSAISSWYDGTLQQSMKMSLSPYLRTHCWWGLFDA